MHRRNLLQLGLSGAASLSLPGLLAARAAQPAGSSAQPAGSSAQPAGSSAQPAGRSERTAVILLYCHGGISHLDTWDPKPDAPQDIRGPFAPIATQAPGVFISELLPLQAQVADKFVLLRSLAHEASCHANGPKRLFTGHFTANQEFKPEHPDCLAIANYLRWQPGRTIPNYVGMTTYGLEPGPVSAIGPAYLGEQYAPLAILGDPNKPGTKGGLTVDADGRLAGRSGLLADVGRALGEPAPQLMREFQQQALDILCSADAHRAFDLEQEPPAVRDRYGRTAWGQQCLIARRLVEAGVDLVTVTLCGPEAGGAGNNWDDHAVNCHIFDALRQRAPNFDRCISTLISELFERGLNERVLLVVTSEFGRTPRINSTVGSQTKVLQPGRDHWPQAMSLLFAGGGIEGGRVVGATNSRGEHPAQRPLGPWDFIATIYAHLGIDATGLAVHDRSDRPVLILPEGAPIPELTRT